MSTGLFCQASFTDALADYYKPDLLNIRKILDGIIA